MLNNKLSKGSTKSKGTVSGGRLQIPVKTQLKLWVHAGGRCAFYGCNEYLLTDSLTLSEANYSNIAHIVSWSLDGPRGSDPLPQAKRNNIENLMLVCTKHHKTIDSEENVKDYPKERLQQFKGWHEDRILRVTQYHPQSRTTVVRLKANVKDRVVEIPLTQIREAIAPRYPSMTECNIDLTMFSGGDERHHWEAMAAVITQKVEKLYELGFEKEPVEHVSVFAIAPMPLLVHLGRRLSDKIETDLYQRHRIPEGWAWKTGGDRVNYKIHKLREGQKKTKVALLLSLSGALSIEELPGNINDDFSVYEITLDGIPPNPLFLRTKDDLDEFKAVYHGLWGDLKRDHAGLKELHVFPAVPAPVAVLCGRERLSKVSPALLVYDKDEDKGGFKFTLKVS